MNTRIIACILMLLTHQGFSQTKDLINGSNELRLNIPMTIAGLPEINYERIMDENLGLGLSLAVAAEKPDRMVYRGIIMPYSRLYFGKRKASGFYIEANMAGVQQREIDSEWIGTDTSGFSVFKDVNRRSFNFGFGAAIGVKLIAKRGYVGDLYAGGGRLFGNSISGGYLRLGLALGKRF